MATRFATTHHLVNLFRNGNLELAQVVDAKTVPAFWVIDGAVPDELGNSDTITSFKVLQDQTIEIGGSDNFLSIIMQEADTVTIGQSFLRGTGTSFDFPTPLAPGTRRSLASGYLNDTDVLIPYGSYSAGFSIKVSQGSVVATLVAYDLLGEVIPLTFNESSQLQTINAVGKYSRVTFSFNTPKTISRLDLQLTRSPGSGLVEMRLTKASMAAGVYSDLPFLPDPLINCFPEGAIVLSMGDSCPSGFEEIGNDNLTPLAEWVTTNPTAQGRKGNFPRSASEQSGTEKHTAITDFTAFSADTVDFPSTTNLDVVKNTTNIDKDYINPSGDLPGGDDGTPTHKHQLSTTGTRPVSWAFRLCKRL